MSAEIHLREGNSAHGKITNGLAAGTLIERTIEFVLTELPNGVILHSGSQVSSGLKKTDPHS